MGVYTQPYRSDELYHFGIKGMHWGIRRYQNPDGTWKNAGKNRHAAQVKKSESGAERSTDMGEKDAPKKSGFHLSDKQKASIKKGLTIAGVALAAYGAYKIGSQLSDENDKWHNTRKLVNKYTSALTKEREANNTYNSRLADKNSSVESLVRADRRRFKAADKRFDASARMTEYSRTKLNKEPNIFQQHANKQRALGSSGRTSSGHSKDAEEMLRSFAENERDKERIKSQTASNRDAFRKATSKPTSLETIRKSASTGEHNVPAIKLEFGSGGNNSTGSDYAKKILAANNATSKSLGQVKTDYSDMDDYVQELLRRSRR